MEWFLGLNPIIQALLATTFTWLMTATGASTVFLFKQLSRRFLDIMLGFTGGVMLSAAFFSLLKPALEIGGSTGFSRVIPVAIGFLGGALFLFLMDKILPHLHLNSKEEEKEGVPVNWNKSYLLVLAITLHNIPEGLAIGMAFGAVAAGLPGAEIGAAFALTLGIAIQNFPEGIAVSMPLRRLGLSKFKSFWWGQMSAIVEPVAGVLGALLVFQFQPLLPYSLSFAAGAMIYVVVEEVIPESQRDKYSDQATLGFVVGFIIMMILDTALV
ncbi:MAG: ZIP family metal transporter [Luteibaculaceae bacterium]